MSFGMAGVIILLFLQVGPSPLTTYLLPPAATALASMLFALKWPQRSWRWGLWLSCGFWVFFLAIFIAYLSIGHFDWALPLRAASVVAAGVVGASAGTAFRRRPSARTTGIASVH